MKYLDGKEIKAGDVAVFGRSHFSCVGIIKEVFEDHVKFFCKEEGTEMKFFEVSVYYNGFEKLA